MPLSEESIFVAIKSLSSFFSLMIFVQETGMSFYSKGWIQGRQLCWVHCSFDDLVNFWTSQWGKSKFFTCTELSF
jgi:hypothetical protein